MESKKLMLVLMMCGIVLHGSSQKIWDNRKGCIRAQGNLAGGYLFSQKKMIPYITGDADVYFHEQVSAGGSIWISLPVGKQNETGVRFNSAVFGGLSYHFVKKGRWDPYIGLQPGMGVVNVVYRNGDVLQHTGYKPVPLLNAVAGCNYYMGSFFHFFARVQGVTGQVFAEMPAPSRLDELKVTAGLGWNLRLWKAGRKKT